MSFITIANNSKLRKILNSKALINKKELRFKKQRKTILLKFNVNSNYYTTKTTKITYIYNLIKGKA